MNTTPPLAQALLQLQAVSLDTPAEARAAALGALATAARRTNVAAIERNLARARHLHAVAVGDAAYLRQEYRTAEHNGAPASVRDAIFRADALVHSLAGAITVLEGLLLELEAYTPADTPAYA
jgi:hypothetical protein